MKKLIRITTVPISLDKLIDGQMSFMNNHYEVTAVSSELKYLEKCACNEKVKYHHLEMSRKITPVKDTIALIKLIRFLIKEKPLIIHSHTPKAGIIAMLAAKVTNVPIRLHTVGGLPLMEAKGLKRKVLEAVEKLTYSCATKVYPNSKGLYDFILSNNFTYRNKLKFIGNGSTNGINTSHFSPDSVLENDQEKLKIELGILNDDFVYVFAGRLVGDKGINELIVAFKKIAQYNFKVKLLLVGSQESDLDPLKNSTLEEIKRNKKIISVGFQQDVRPYFSISNVLVFPSYREGFPNVVMQAGAMGLPTIATNINGCNEIIVDGLNGILIPYKNSSALEFAMSKIVNEKDYFLNLKSNSRQMITSRFEQNIIWESILKEYKSLELNLINSKKQIRYETESTQTIIGV